MFYNMFWDNALINKCLVAECWFNVNLQRIIIKIRLLKVWINKMKKFTLDVIKELNH